MLGGRKVFSVDILCRQTGQELVQEQRVSGKKEGREGSSYRAEMRGMETGTARPGDGKTGFSLGFCWAFSLCYCVYLVPFTSSKGIYHWLAFY